MVVHCMTLAIMFRYVLAFVIIPSTLLSGLTSMYPNINYNSKVNVKTTCSAGGRCMCRCQCAVHVGGDVGGIVIDEWGCRIEVAPNSIRSLAVEVVGSNGVHISREVVENLLRGVDTKIREDLLRWYEKMNVIASVGPLPKCKTQWKQPPDTKNKTDPREMFESFTVRARILIWLKNIITWRPIFKWSA